MVTLHFHDTFGGSDLNQADHIATGRETLDAAVASQRLGVRCAAAFEVFPLGWGD